MHSKLEIESLYAIVPIIHAYKNLNDVSLLDTFIKQTLSSTLKVFETTESSMRWPGNSQLRLLRE
jgi:hypothetical protein